MCSHGQRQFLFIGYLMTSTTFRSPEYLLTHIQSILKFYDANVDDPAGGFFQNFRDDGSVFDAQTRHLVSSTRFVFNYARAYLQFGREKDAQRVRHGVSFLREVHRNADTGGYFWLIKREQTLPSRTVTTQVLDDTNHCYGMAFVLLAYSWAYRAGVQEAKAYLEETWQLLEAKFWEPAHQLYRDEANGDFSQWSSYRGQNANMHSCEALIAAYHATQESKFLQRALVLAQNITQRQAALSDGFVWEHFTSDWQVDWEFNLDDPENLFRPWGFQPGHQIEWAKLLLMLNQLEQHQWLVDTAVSLVDRSLAIAWDQNNGGLVYGFAPDKRICDANKYYWVQAEAVACLAWLAQTTQRQEYWQWYDKLWAYCEQHFIDHKHGAWYRMLTPTHEKTSIEKSPMGKTDYHTMGACYDILSAFLLNE